VPAVSGENLEQPPARRLISVCSYWSLWGAILAVWTGALLSSEVAKQGSAVLPAGWLFIASKGLHFTAYAILAALVCWLPAWRWLRILAWVGLLGHGALT
jgi:hypothetical protein